MSAALKKEMSVAPCVGAWIETGYEFMCNFNDSVAPCVGAWIETSEDIEKMLKETVAPCVGAWIETRRSQPYAVRKQSRSLRGSVD